MISSNVYICGCIRNSGQYVAPVFENLKKIAALFDKAHIIVSYDESNDNTMEELMKQQSSFDNFDIIVGKTPLTPWRTVNISNARNRIIEKIRACQTEKPDADKWKYFIMVDLDNVCSGPMFLDVFQRQFEPEREKMWDSVSFHRSDYYDIWALSLYPYMYSCWHYQNPHSVVDYLMKMMNNLLNSMDTNELLPCHSAFGGFAIYKCDPFLKCSYNGKMDFSYFDPAWIQASRDAFPHLELYGTSHDVDCEHRTFHFEAIQKYGARIFISPGKLFTNV